MRPFAVLNAIVFGSSAAITFGLGGVIVIFLVLKGRYPEMLGEFGALLQGGAMFALLTAASGTSLFATLKHRAWRHAAQVAMWLCVLALVFLYWPR
jgi:ABC-type molybdate transport system permease subunit